MTILPEVINSIPRVKICGITRVEDARLALDLGASFLGLILTRKSPRYLPLDEAEALLAELRRGPHAVRAFGVFVDESPAEMAAAVERLGLLAAQIHGSSEPATALLGAERVIPAVAIRDEAAAAAMLGLPDGHPGVLADSFSPGAHGGTGRVFNHALVRDALPRRRVLLAGGLTPDNIGSVVAALGPAHQPYAYDLSSGVEAEPRIKDHDKLRRFFDEFHSALRTLGA